PKKFDCPVHCRNLFHRVVTTFKIVVVYIIPRLKSSTQSAPSPHTTRTRRRRRPLIFSLLLSWQNKSCPFNPVPCSHSKSALITTILKPIYYVVRMCCDVPDFISRE